MVHWDGLGLTNKSSGFSQNPGVKHLNEVTNEVLNLCSQPRPLFLFSMVLSCNSNPKCVSSTKYNNKKMIWFHNVSAVLFQTYWGGWYYVQWFLLLPKEHTRINHIKRTYLLLSCISGNSTNISQVCTCWRQTMLLFNLLWLSPKLIPTGPVAKLQVVIMNQFIF